MPDVDDDDDDDGVDDDLQTEMPPTIRRNHSPQSFFARPGIFAGKCLCSTMIIKDSNTSLPTAVIGGTIVCLLFAILIAMCCVYRMRKKDEGSYALEAQSLRGNKVKYPNPYA